VRSQQRLEYFFDHLLRDALKLEVSFVGHLPKLIEPSCASTLKSENLHQQIDYVGGFDELRLKARTLLVILV